MKGPCAGVVLGAVSLCACGLFPDLGGLVQASDAGDAGVEASADGGADAGTDAATCTQSGSKCDDGDPCTLDDACIQGVCGGGSVDTSTPACVSATKPIYRSVGPGNSSALASGGVNGALAVVGTTAAFDQPLPTRVGVGDVLLYDTNADNVVDGLAFIHARLSSTVYAVRTAAGLTPVAIPKTTTWQILRAYTSLDNAVTGSENTSIPAALTDFDKGSSGQDLVSPNLQWNIACYDDGVVDTAAVTICNRAYATSGCSAGTGWATGPQNYLRVFTPTAPSEVGTSQRHDGRWGKGYRRSDAGIGIWAGYVRIDGMSIHQTSTARTYIAYTPGIAGEVEFKNSFAWALQRSFDVWSAGGTGSGVAVVRYENCIGIHDSTTDPAGAFYINSDKASAFISNCTGVASAGGAFKTVYPNNVLCNNCLGYARGAAVAFAGAFLGMITSASNDGTAPSTGGAGNIGSATFSFVDATNQDFHLDPAASLNTAIRGKGTNLTTDLDTPFASDIDGDPRPSSGSWDVGSDQVP